MIHRYERTAKRSCPAAAIIHRLLDGLGVGGVRLEGSGCSVIFFGDATEKERARVREILEGQGFKYKSASRKECAGAARPRASAKRLEDAVRVENMDAGMDDEDIVIEE